MDPSFRIEERRTMNRIESRNHVCPKCSQGYKNKRTLDTHLRTVCGREPKFHCPYCGLRSKHPPNIYTHIRRRHKGEDLFLIVDKDQRCWSIVLHRFLRTFVNFFSPPSPCNFFMFGNIDIFLFLLNTINRVFRLLSWFFSFRWYKKKEIMKIIVNVIVNIFRMKYIV